MSGKTLEINKLDIVCGLIMVATGIAGLAEVSPYLNVTSGIVFFVWGALILIFQPAKRW